MKGLNIVEMTLIGIGMMTPIICGVSIFSDHIMDVVAQYADERARYIRHMRAARAAWARYIRHMRAARAAWQGREE